MNGHDPEVARLGARIALEAIEHCQARIGQQPAILRDQLSIISGALLIDALAASLVINVHLLPETLRPSDEFIAACAAIGAAKGAGEAQS